MMAGDTSYFHLMREGVFQISQIYPNARILIFDYGLLRNDINILSELSRRIEVIDWRPNIDDLSLVENDVNENQKHNLALAFNARRTGFIKRFRKFILKRFPKSSFSKKIELKALRFENLLLQKIKCIQHASQLCGGERLVYLDADAILFETIDDVFEAGADVNVTLIDDLPTWGTMSNIIINAGVIFFGANSAARNAFLDAWWLQALETNEWLREQASLVRLLEKESREMFRVNSSALLKFNNVEVKVRFLSCDQYNFIWMENSSPETFPDARIFHFTSRRQEKKLFWEILNYLRMRKANEHIT
jgi:hypothetical protein